MSRKPDPNPTGSELNTTALLTTVACMLLLLYVGAVALVDVFSLLQPPQGSRLGWLGLLLLHVGIAGGAITSALGLYARPRLFSLVALAALSLFLWRGLYLVYQSAGAFAPAAPEALLRVWPAAVALVILVPVVKTWMRHA